MAEEWNAARSSSSELSPGMHAMCTYLRINFFRCFSVGFCVFVNCISIDAEVFSIKHICRTGRECWTVACVLLQLLCPPPHSRSNQPQSARRAPPGLFLSIPGDLFLPHSPLSHPLPSRTGPNPLSHHPIICVPFPASDGPRLPKGRTHLRPPCRRAAAGSRTGGCVSPVRMEGAA